VRLFQVAVGLRWVSMGASSPYGVGTLPGCTALDSTVELGKVSVGI